MTALIIILQVACIIAVTAGIVIEWLYGANLGFLLITIGAFFFAITTKLIKRQMKHDLRYYKSKKST